MDYWNRDNREGLMLIADSLCEDPELAPIGRYCNLRVQGLRKQALEEIRSFTQVAAGWSSTVQRATLKKLLQLWYDHPEVHQLLPRPLLDGFVRPALADWLSDEPASAEGLRWSGLVNDDRAAFEQALSLDESDGIARARLVSMLLNDVDYATHHLAEGRFIGSEAAAMENLARARSLLGEATDLKATAGLWEWHGQLRLLFEDWQAYSRSPEGPFKDWCERKGHHHDWWITVPYDR